MRGGFIAAEAACSDSESEEIIREEDDSDRAFINDSPEAVSEDEEAYVDRIRVLAGIDVPAVERQKRAASPPRANLDVVPKKKAKRDYKAEGQRRAPRYTNWVFTLNNYQEKAMPRFNKIKMSWLRYGEEVGDEGTPHLQGVVVLIKNKKSSFEHIHDGTTLGEWAKDCHWERMKGTIEQNLLYTGKEATADPTKLHEWGERPLTNTERNKKGTAASKETMKEVIAAAEKGDFDWIKAEHPGHYLRYQKNLDKIRMQAIVQGAKPSHDSLENYWIHGETGSGKTRAVRDKIPDKDLYLKGQNKWWDHYEGENYVLIDDFSPEWQDKYSLKNWADHYSFSAEYKGGSLKRMNPKTIIVTSNYKIEEAGFNEKDIEPMIRRFKRGNAQWFIDTFKIV